MTISREELISKLNVVMAIIGNLPELPGYNGSVLVIDDIEAENICRDLGSISGAISAIEAQYANKRL